MALGKRDPLTGKHTTGHEWAGITEFDTPIPRFVYLCYGVTFVVAVIMWVLLPTWPLFSSYTPGLLGFSQADFVEGQLAEAAGERAAWSDKIAAMDLDAIALDREARAIAARTGETLFGDNCAGCHGTAAKGGPGFPNLTDTAWLWGGTPAAIHETLRVGINSSHEDTRVGQMLAFGRDQVLDRAAIQAVVTYVRSLSGLEPAEGEAVESGQAVFAEQCAGCHGETATGNSEVGAPNLTDNVWIYGGGRQDVFATVYGGRQGQMPHWSGRLDDVQLKLLALYVHSLSQP